MRGFISAILPGSRDGAKSIDESLAMFHAARDAGMTSITCTPRFVDPDVDYLPMWRAFRMFEQEVRAIDPTFPLQMGFMVDSGTLVELGTEWADRLHFDGSNEFLIGLSPNVDKSELAYIERLIGDLQELGLKVILSHPERSAALASDPALARTLVAMDCKLMVSASAAGGERDGDESWITRYLLDEGLCSYFVVDEPDPKGFDDLARAVAAQDSVLLNGRPSAADQASAADTHPLVLASSADDVGKGHDDQVEDQLQDIGSLSSPTKPLPVRPISKNGSRGSGGAHRSGGAHGAGGSKRKGRLVAIVAGSVVAVACVAGLAFALTRPAPKKEAGQSQVQAQTEAVQAAEAPGLADQVVASARIEVVAPGLDAQGSRVPLHISGTQADGTQYENDIFVEAGTSHIELPEGTYVITAVETPISADGTLYRVPEDVLKVVVSKDGTAMVTPEGVKFEFHAVSASDISDADALIESARQWILRDPERSELADELAATAHDALQDAETGNTQSHDESERGQTDEEESRSEGSEETSSSSSVRTAQNQQESDWSSRWQQEPEDEQQEEATQQETEQPDQQQEQQESGQQGSEQEGSGQQNGQSQQQESTNNSSESGSGESANNPA